MQRDRSRGNFLPRVTRALTHMFPVPEFLAPRSVGVDISEASIKWIMLGAGEKGKRKVESWGRQELPEGIVVAGVVRDPARLSDALREIKKRLPRGVAAHAALPEEPAFVFEMTVPLGSSRKQILSLIEFEFEARVPIPPSSAVYDFDLLPQMTGEAQQIGVVVLPRDIADGYATAFEGAGMDLRSLELEARSIARAVVPASASAGVELLVDFGFKRTGLALLKRGIPIFTSTVDVGGETVSRALSEKLHISPEDAQKWKNEEGLLPSEGAKSPGLEALSGAASSLGSEVARHFNYWDTRRNDRGERVTPVSRVLLIGGSANMKGLGDYLSGRVQAPVERPNVWENVCSFDDYIPPIDRKTSLQYATALGLALRS